MGISIRIQFLVALAALVAGCANTKSSMHAPGDTASPQAFERTPLSSAHPLVGVWRIEVAKTVLRPPSGYDSKCIEEYAIRADGTKSSMSGEERNESEFMISPATKGVYWYKWVDKITANNSKPDCMGSHTAIGHTAVNYVILHPSGDRFALCGREDMNSCYVELFKQAR